MVFNLRNTLFKYLKVHSIFTYGMEQFNIFKNFTIARNIQGDVGQEFCNNRFQL